MQRHLLEEQIRLTSTEKPAELPFPIVSEKLHLWSGEAVFGNPDYSYFSTF